MAGNLGGGGAGCRPRTRHWKLAVVGATLVALVAGLAFGGVAPTPAAAVGERVYVVGDSLSVGMRAAGLASFLGQSGLSLTGIDATVGINVGASIPKVRADAAAIQASDEVVVQLGTNNCSISGAVVCESTPAFESEISAMLATIRSIKPTVRVLWVNIFTTKGSGYSSINNAIAAESGPLGYTVIDWAREVTTHPGRYTFDGALGVHPQGSGYQNMAQFIATQLGVAGCLPPPSPAWNGWGSLDGTLTSGPSVASWAAGRLDVFARGADNHLWHRFFDGGWSSWESLGGVLTSAPAVASWAAGRLDVFARGADNGLVHRFYDRGWSAWEQLGGQLASAPAVASWAAGRLDVFVRGVDNGLAHRFYAGSWSGWESLGGALASGPASASWSAGRLDVFVRGTDSGLWHKYYQSGWSVWEPLGGTLSSAPAVAAPCAGVLEVFANGNDKALWRRSYLGGWSGWDSLGGRLVGAPSASAWGPNRFAVFVRGTDDRLWWRTS